MASTVLVLTALEDITADLVVGALNDREVAVMRCDPADIGRGLSFAGSIGAGTAAWSGRLRTASRSVELEDVASVYYRRPTSYSDRYADLPAQARDFATAEARHGLGGLLHSIPGARYVNHPAAVARADFKPAQLQLAARIGLQVPPTLVTNDVDAARSFADEHGPVVYKTFRGLPPGTDGGAGAIWTQRVASETFDEAISVTAHMFQAEIPKACDVRMTVVGRQVFAQRIIEPNGELDWRRGRWDDLRYEPVVVPQVIKAAALDFLGSMHLAFGCFDCALCGSAVSPESWWFIECNSNGQWGWLPDFKDIAEAFADLLAPSLPWQHPNGDRGR
ncbi:ATP-grasp ribosomal peptide maturase [Yinghuangia soli]|uniref:ATP-grasp ribosomal peptide maturase n=1 Tax=Yinghuangia soli TaxID=2908204 RepID=A0AA41Q8H1_9ACTN|nr:ATP-grasp ribosomal peptide maturase [Yinghuangia soli]MCF2532137.1 ATP-grasp ribosomal peptide maturase [Yinghuangia soli]